MRGKKLFRKISTNGLQITIEAIESDAPEIALQGIEFWSTVCDEEVDLAIELSEVSIKVLI